MNEARQVPASVHRPWNFGYSLAPPQYCVLLLQRDNEVSHLHRRRRYPLRESDYGNPLPVLGLPGEIQGRCEVRGKESPLSQVPAGRQRSLGRGAGGGSSFANRVVHCPSSRALSARAGAAGARAARPERPVCWAETERRAATSGNQARKSQYETRNAARSPLCRDSRRTGQEGAQSAAALDCRRRCRRSAGVGHRPGDFLFPAAPAGQRGGKDRRHRQ